MNEPPPNPVAGAIGYALVSPNEGDSNGEPANVVDGLFAIARAVDGLAAAIRGEPDPWHAPGRSIEEVRLP
jgi:hypothetical protein